jgi:hypothetical protein
MTSKSISNVFNSQFENPLGISEKSYNEFINQRSFGEPMLNPRDTIKEINPYEF